MVCLLIGSTHLSRSGSYTGGSALRRKFKTNWIIPFRDIKLGAKLGAGACGIVYRGTCRGADVAIKVLKSKLDESALAEFKHEVEVMQYGL